MILLKKLIIKLTELHIMIKEWIQSIGSIETWNIYIQNK